MSTRFPVYGNAYANTYLHVGRGDEVVLEKEFDPTAALEHAAFFRNEVKQTGELRKAMSVPAPLFFEWIKTGKLGEVAYVDGKPIVDMVTLRKLWAEYDGLRCMDKL